MRWVLIRAALVVVWVLTAIARFGTPAVEAQERASVRGTVVDPLGARVVGATVTLVRDGTLPVKETKSDPQGEFMFDGLVEGRYQIEAASPGFQNRMTDPTFVAAGARLTIEVPLPIGPLETSVAVTAVATDVLPSQIGAPVTVVDSETLIALGKTDILEALRLVPGSSLVQSGGKGGVTSMFIRGGNSNFNKVLIDGTPANDIGGGIDLAQFSTTGVERIEVLRESNSIVFGSDALAGVINVISRRGRSRIPEAAMTLDVGNLGTNREAGSLGGALGRFDYFSEFSRFGTDNDAPNNKYRNKTYAGRFGVAVGRNTDVSGTVRWIDRRFELPNGMSLYGTPDDAFQTNRLTFFGVGAQTQITDRWQTAARVGATDQRSGFVNPSQSGEIIGGVGLGKLVTIQGANGSSATGRAILDFGGTFPSVFSSRSARQGAYGQTTYQVRSDVALSAGAHIEREQGFTNPDADPTTTRKNGGLWVEGRGTLMNRVSVTAGVGYAHNAAFKSAYSPRVTAVASLRSPTATEAVGDTRLTFNFGQAIKAPSIGAEQRSLYTLLNGSTSGAAIAAAHGIQPIGPERARNVDVGLEQGFLQGRVRARAAYFNNEFFDLIEFVSRTVLPQLGVSADAANAANGANVNSQSFKAQGAELSLELRLAERLRIGGSYTHLDAVITKSSAGGAISPAFNPAFPGVPIGSFSPLVGAQPFRRPRNVGNLFVSCTGGRAHVSLSAYFAGKSDDSTFIAGSDQTFGNSLLLPNRELNFGYAKVDLSASYRFHRSLKWFATVENVMNQHYEPVFGFPGLPINVRTGVTVLVGGR